MTNDEEDVANTPSDSTSARLSGRDIAWLTGAGLVCGTAIVVAGSFGHGGRVELATILFSGTTAAGMLFRKKHCRWWFWPCLLLLIGGNIILLLVLSWQTLPAPAAYAMRGAVTAAFGLNSLALWWAGWLFDPHQNPRTSASITAEIVLYGFAAVIFGIIAFVWWAVVRAEQQARDQAVMVLARSSTLSVEDLERCLAPSVDSDSWEDVAGRYPARRLQRAFTDLGLIVVDQGNTRSVRATTLRGRPLIDRERAVIDAC